jgi:hypothetical protein
MGKIIYANKVFRLIKPIDLSLTGVPEVMKFKKGEEFHIVMDVLYMNGFPLPTMFQAPLINWIVSNPKLFVDDTRNF